MTHNFREVPNFTNTAATGIEDTRRNGVGFIQRQPPYFLYSTPIGHEVNLYLSEHIGAPSEYVEVLATLRSLTYRDRLNVYINNGGGRVDTGVQLISGLLDCQAYVTMILDCTAMSMASTMLFVANEIQIKPSAQLMFHAASGGFGGKMHEAVNNILHTAQWTADILSRHCYPFLTAEELQKVVEGADVYLGYTEILKRLPLLGEVVPDAPHIVVTHATLSAYDPTYIPPHLKAKDGSTEKADNTTKQKAIRRRKQLPKTPNSN